MPTTAAQLRRHTAGGELTLSTHGKRRSLWAPHEGDGPTGCPDVMSAASGKGAPAPRPRRPPPHGELPSRTASRLPATPPSHARGERLVLLAPSNGLSEGHLPQGATPGDAAVTPWKPRLTDSADIAKRAMLWEVHGVTTATCRAPEFDQKRLPPRVPRRRCQQRRPSCGAIP